MSEEGRGEGGRDRRLPVRQFCKYLHENSIVNVPYRTLYNHLGRARRKEKYGVEVKLGRPFELTTEEDKMKLHLALEELARIKQSSLTKAEILECGELCFVLEL